MNDVRCLYLMYWGATEPIGQAGPLPTITELSRAGEKVVLVSFDKPDDKADSLLVDALRRKLAARDIPWFDLRYSKRPPNLSTAWDILKGVVAGHCLVARHRISVVHGRTYVGAIIGALIRSSSPGVRFVCHEDGFWAHEKVDDGFWLEGSTSHRLGLAIERFFHHRADAIIVLSERARDVLRRDPVLANTPIHVVHTSVDLSRFAVCSPRSSGDPLRIIHLGSLGRRYLAAETFRFFAAARSAAPATVATVATRMSAEVVDAALDAADLPHDAVERVCLKPGDVPTVLARQHAGIFFLRDGLSNVATSATKVGEYLASGLAVVLTPDCGDLHDIVESTRTGIVVREHSSRAYQHAFERLLDLTADPTLPARARMVAEETMGLERSVATQREVHQHLAAQVSRRSASRTRPR